MPALSLAVDTGRLRGRAQVVVWILRLGIALIAVQVGILAYMHFGTTDDVRWQLATLVMCVGCGLAAERWLRKSLDRVDVSLADGGPMRVLDARLQLLDTALVDAVSPLALVVQFGLAPAAVCALGWAAYDGRVHVAVPVLVGVALAALLSAVRTMWVPYLRRERAAVLEMRAQLKESATP